MGRNMKDSGIEWIREIPEEWTETRLKDYYTFEKGRNSALYTKEYIGLNKGIYPVYSGQTENEGIMGLINSYDYNIEECLFTTTVGAKVMTPKILHGKFSLSQNCLIMNSRREINNRFVFYILLPLFDFEKSSIPSHMQPSLRVSDLNKYNFFAPTLKEQKKIVDFLDQKVAQMDSIIESTKLSVKDFKRYKQSLVIETVTKGLNPNVEMKDTQVSWIGDIPVNWSTIKTKYIFTIKKEIANEEGHDILSVTQKGLKVKDISKNEGQISTDYSKYQFVNTGDFVMNHMDLLTGWVDCSNFKGVTSPDYRVFKFINDSGYSSDYYKYIFQACYSNKIYYGLGQGVSNLGRWRLQADKFINFVLPVPNLEEQNEIVSFLNFKCAQIDSLIEQKQRLIKELENYKKSLVFEYVTGKKEVL